MLWIGEESGENLVGEQTALRCELQKVGTEREQPGFRQRLGDFAGALSVSRSEALFDFRQ